MPPDRQSPPHPKPPKLGQHADDVRHCRALCYVAVVALLLQRII